jgi:cyclase
MPLPRLIPCLDVARGRVVKGVSFVGLRDVGDPVELAAFYGEGGADELVFLDIAATPEDANTMLDVVTRVADVLDIPFTVGGGVRSLDDASRIIEAGADRVSINSAALADPTLITLIADRFGAQAVVVAIDAGEGVVHTHGGRVATDLATIPWAIEAASRGAGEILLTSIGHDGHRNGYDLALTRAVHDALSIPVIASGGAGNARHVAEALAVADAALVASIVHENPQGLPGLRAEIQGLGVALRPVRRHHD